jgi:hypothetical protein
VDLQGQKELPLHRFRADAIEMLVKVVNFLQQNIQATERAVLLHLLDIQDPTLQGRQQPKGIVRKFILTMKLNKESLFMLHVPILPHPDTKKCRPMIFQLIFHFIRRATELGTANSVVMYIRNIESHNRYGLRPVVILRLQISLTNTWACAGHITNKACPLLRCIKALLGHTELP